MSEKRFHKEGWNALLTTTVSQPPSSPPPPLQDRNEMGVPVYCRVVLGRREGENCRPFVRLKGLGSLALLSFNPRTQIVHMPPSSPPSARIVLAISNFLTRCTLSSLSRHCEEESKEYHRGSLTPKNSNP